VEAGAGAGRSGRRAAGQGREARDRGRADTRRRLNPSHPLIPAPASPMTRTALSSRRERERNLLFLSTPRLWPAYPFLPVVRRTAFGEECGLLMDLAGLFGLFGYG